MTNTLLETSKRKSPLLQDNKLISNKISEVYIAIALETSRKQFVL